MFVSIIWMREWKGDKVVTDKLEWDCPAQDKS